MPYASSYGAKGTENGCVLLNRMYSYVAPKTGVLWCHGHGSGGEDVLNPASVQPHMAALVEAGFPVVSMDMGGKTTWGYTAATGKTANALTQLQSAGAKSGKVIALAASMGVLTALRSILTGALTTSNLAAIGLLLPASSLVDLHDNNRGGFATEIEAAYAVAGTYAGNGTITPLDPYQNPSSFTSWPMSIWYGLSDTTVPPSVATGFASAVNTAGGRVTATGAAGVGHTSACATPAQVLAFVQANAQ